MTLTIFFYLKNCNIEFLIIKALIVWTFIYLNFKMSRYNQWQTDFHDYQCFCWSLLNQECVICACMYYVRHVLRCENNKLTVIYRSTSSRNRINSVVENCHVCHTCIWHVFGGSQNMFYTPLRISNGNNSWSIITRFIIHFLENCYSLSNAKKHKSFNIVFKNKDFINYIVKDTKFSSRS